MVYKKLICILLCLILAGCSSPKPDESTAVSVEVTPETSKPAEETISEEVEIPQDRTFLEEQQLVITPQGDFEYTAWAEKGTFPMHASCNITEEPSDSEGYKRVIATIVYDVSDSPGGMIRTREFAFDRYTGTCFDTTNEQPGILESDDSVLIESGVNVTYEDKEYKIAYAMQMTNKWPQLIVELMVLCPQDYDGTVFVVRYADEDTNVADTAFDWEGVHTIDELPYYNTVETFYFTKSDH
ncbi:MAG: hypothetical protein IJK53_05560 [Erysipelotrichaceae bacterium]|nr:hypothetical protein [Erysipelotrichaceae bacterium]